MNISGLAAVGLRLKSDCQTVTLKSLLLNQNCEYKLVKVLINKNTAGRESMDRFPRTKTSIFRKPATVLQLYCNSHAAEAAPGAVRVFSQRGLSDIIGKHAFSCIFLRFQPLK